MQLPAAQRFIGYKPDKLCCNEQSNTDSYLPSATCSPASAQHHARVRMGVWIGHFQSSLPSHRHGFAAGFEPWQPCTRVRRAGSPGPAPQRKGEWSTPSSGSPACRKGRDESIPEGHSCMVWVEQSSNFFPRRLYSLQKSFLFIPSSGAQQLAAPQLLRTRAATCGKGTLTHPSAAPGRQGQQHNTQPGLGAPLGTDVTLRGQGSPLSHKVPLIYSPSAVAVLSAHGCSDHACAAISAPSTCGRQPGTSVASAARCRGAEAERMLEEALGFLLALSHSCCAIRDHTTQFPQVKSKYNSASYRRIVLLVQKGKRRF